jgi:hypothetical protein
MTPQERKVMELALGALEKLTNAAEGFSVSGVYFNEELWARKCLDDAYDAMGLAQEALAQPEQEPQKGGCTWCGGDCPQFECDTHSTWMNEPVIRRDMPPQRTWVGLTEQEIDYQAKKDDHAVYFALGALWAEAKLKEKNT